MMSMAQRGVVWFLVLALTLVLAACGGGASTGGGSSVAAVNTSATATATLTDSTGNRNNRVPIGGQSTILVNVVDANRAPLASAIVSAKNTATTASLIPASGSVLTDASGNAKLGISGLVEGADTVAITITYKAADGSNQSVNVSLNYEVFSPVVKTETLTAALEDGTGKANSKVPLGGRSNLKINFVDGDKKPIANAVITSKNTDTVASFVPASGSTITDANGAATLGVSGVTEGADTITVTATFKLADGNSKSVQATLNYAVVAPPADQAETLGAIMVDASGARSNRVAIGGQTSIQVNLVDAKKVPIANALVSASNTATMATISPSNGTSLTDASGNASFALSGLLTGADTLTLTATFKASDGRSKTLNLPLNYLVVAASGQAASLSLSIIDGAGAVNNRVPVGGQSTLRIKLLDASNKAIANAKVTASNTATIAAFVPSSASALTDDQGNARLGITGLLDAADTINVSAVYRASDGTDKTVTAAINYVSVAPVSEVPLLSAVLLDETGAPSSRVAIGGQSTLRVRLLDGANNPLPGAIISLKNTDTVAALVPASGSTLTDVGGNALLGLSGLTEAADTLTITANYKAPDGTSKSVSLSLNYLSVVNRSANLTANLTGGLIDPKGNASDRILLGTRSNLVIKLVDPKNAPIASASISVINNSAIASLTPVSGTTLTDASGAATIGVTGLTEGADTLAITANYIDASGNPKTLSLSVNYLTNSSLGGMVAALNDASGASSSFVPVGSQSTLKISVFTPTGKPIPNTILSIRNNSTLASLSPASGSVLTDANGNASVGVLGLVEGADTLTIEADYQLEDGSKGGLTRAVRYAVTPGSGNADKVPTVNVSIVGSGGGNSVQAGIESTVIATVLDAGGQAVPNAIVTFSNDSTFGSFNPPSATALTDSSGRATIGLIGTSKLGADVLKASATIAASGGTTLAASGSVNYQVIATSVPTALSLALVGAGASSSIQTGVQVSLVATALGADGKPVPNVLVTFSNDSTFASFVPASGSVLTDQSGNATIGVVATNKLGADVFKASATLPAAGGSGNAVTASLNYQVVGGTAAATPTMSLSLTNAAGAGLANNTITQGTQAKVTATLLDSSGRPLANELVIFTAGSNVALSPSAGTDLSDSRGLAEINLIANGAAGADTITATATVTINGTKIDLVRTLNYKVAAGGTSAVPTLSLGFTDQNGNTVSNPTNAVVSGLTSYVAATVRNELGQPLSGQIVTFTTTGSVASFLPTSGTALTDGNGRAVIGVLGSSTLGAATLTATADIPNQAGSTTAVSKTQNYQVIANPNPNSPPSLQLVLTDARGVEDSTVAPGDSLTVSARLLENGLPVANQRVRFSLTFTGASNSTLSNTSANTDNSGYAQVQLSALFGVLTASTSKVTVTATAIYKSQTLTQSQEVAYASAIPAVDSIVVTYPNGTTPLSYKASATLTIALIDSTKPGRVPFTSSVNVKLESNCEKRGLASFDDTSPFSDGNGLATATYTDLGCGKNDVIVATPDYTGGIAKSTTILLSAAPAPVSSTPTSLQFVDASPTSLSIRGSGGVENSVIRFKLVDGTGAAVAGQTVNFSLQAQTVGIATLNTVSAVTDGQGLVSASLRAGTIGGPVSVTATLSVNTSISSQSTQLFVTTGIPHQNGVSLSPTVLNPEFGSFNGQSISLTLRASDRYGNPIPDGTVASFRTEGGIGTILDPLSVGLPAGSCRIKDGACTVNLTSNGNRTVLEQKPGFNGRQTIVAFLVGEDSFVDSSGNGRFDTGETFPPAGLYFHGDPYFDTNENDTYTAGELYVPLGRPANDGRDGVPAGPFLYHGLACADTSGRCSASSTRYVWDKTVIVWSGSTGVFDSTPAATPPTSMLSATRPFSRTGPYSGTIALNDPTVVGGTCVADFSTLNVRVTDSNGGILPSGTTIAFTTNNASVDTTSYTVPNTRGAAATIPVVITGGQLPGTCAKPASSGVLITVTTPLGIVTTYNLSLL